MDFESREFMVEQINELIEQARSVSTECIPKILAAMDEWWMNITPDERGITIRNCIVSKYNKIVGIYGPSASVRSKVLKKAGIKGKYGMVSMLRDIMQKYSSMLTETPSEQKRYVEPKLKELYAVISAQYSEVNKCFEERLGKLVMEQLAK